MDSQMPGSLFSTDRKGISPPPPWRAATTAALPPRSRFPTLRRTTSMTRPTISVACSASQTTCRFRPTESMPPTAFPGHRRAPMGHAGTTHGSRSCERYACKGAIEATIAVFKRQAARTPRVTSRQLVALKLNHHQHGSSLEQHEPRGIENNAYDRRCDFSGPRLHMSASPSLMLSLFNELCTETTCCRGGYAGAVERQSTRVAAFETSRSECSSTTSVHNSSLLQQVTRMRSRNR